MERPESFSADDLRKKKVSLLEAIPAIENVETIIGQYGKSEDGEKPAFKDEKDVPNDSKCITFCAAVARIENERWTGVPFLLKAGKALHESKTEIVIQFRPSADAGIFQGVVPNRITIQVQPDEGIFLTINSFVPGLQTKVDAIDLDLTYRGRDIPDAYEALLLDAMKGDFSRSVRGDELDASWRIFSPLLHHLDRNSDVKPRKYPYGSMGPEGMDEFMEAYQHDRGV